MYTCVFWGQINNNFIISLNIYIYDLQVEIKAEIDEMVTCFILAIVKNNSKQGTLNYLPLGKIWHDSYYITDNWLETVNILLLPSTKCQPTSMHTFPPSLKLPEWHDMS